MSRSSAASVIPSSTFVGGIRMSVTTTSGRCSSTSRSAASRVPAVATTSTWSRLLEPPYSLDYQVVIVGEHDANRHDAQHRPRPTSAREQVRASTDTARRPEPVLRTFGTTLRSGCPPAGKSCRCANPAAAAGLARALHGRARRRSHRARGREARLGRAMAVPRDRPVMACAVAVWAAASAEPSRPHMSPPEVETACLTVPMKAYGAVTA